MDYNQNKEKYKDNEDTCVDETMKDFNKLKDIFTNGVKSLEKNILQYFLTTIKGKNEEEINDEILTLIKIFKIKNYQLNEIRNSLIILSKKEDIYNISIAISLFLEKLEIKGSLCLKLKEIFQNLEKSNDENTILNAYNDLKSYSIDIDDLYDSNLKEDNYLKILLKLKEHPEAILLFGKIKYNDCPSLKEFVKKIDINFVNNILK